MKRTEHKLLRFRSCQLGHFSHHSFRVGTQFRQLGASTRQFPPFFVPLALPVSRLLGSVIEHNQLCSAPSRHTHTHVLFSRGKHAFSRHLQRSAIHRFPRFHIRENAHFARTHEKGGRKGCRATARKRRQFSLQVALSRGETHCDDNSRAVVAHSYRECISLQLAKDGLKRPLSLHHFDLNHPFGFCGCVMMGVFSRQDIMMGVFSRHCIFIQFILHHLTLQLLSHHLSLHYTPSHLSHHIPLTPFPHQRHRFPSPLHRHCRRPLATRRQSPHPHSQRRRVEHARGPRRQLQRLQAARLRQLQRPACVVPQQQQRRHRHHLRRRENARRVAHTHAEAAQRRGKRTFPACPRHVHAETLRPARARAQRQNGLLAPAVGAEAEQHGR